MDLPDSPFLLVLILRVNKVKHLETVIGLMFCILLFVSLVNSGVYEGGLEVGAFVELLVMSAVVELLVIYWCYYL